MRERLSDYQEKYGDLYNLEGPGGEHVPTVSPSTTATATPDHHRQHERHRTTPTTPPARGLHGGYFLRAGYSGRSPDAVHLRHGVPRLPRRKPDWRAAADLVRKIAENLLPYYTMSPHVPPSATTTATLPASTSPAPSAARTPRLEPHHRLLPSRAELERRQRCRSSGPQRVQYRPQPLHRRHPPPRGLLRRRYRRPRHAAEEVGTVSAAAHTAQLFTRTTCPNCRVAEKMLDKAGLPTKSTAEEHPELCRGIRHQGRRQRALRRCAF